MADLLCVESFLHSLLAEFKWHVREYDRNQPTQRLPALTNSVHPIFKLERWVTGPEQHAAEMYTRMLPALQLVSLCLSEDGPLLWYTRLTFSERRFSAAGRAYLVPTPYSITPQAIASVKAKLIDFSKVITFMFSPKDFHEKENWGTTYHFREKIPFFHKLRAENLPFISPNTGKAHPCIILSRRFDAFFRKTFAMPHLDLDEYHRALFMFACIIGHEVAHAYNFFVHGVQKSVEPFWDIAEKSEELGFSWERNVLGCVPMTMDSKAGDIDSGRFSRLAAVGIVEYHSKDGQKRIMDAVKAGTNADFTQRDASGHRRAWPVVDVSKFRGCTWCPDETAMGFVATIMSIRSRWIAGWFQQTLWRNIRTNWTEKRYYLPPALGECFAIMYDTNASGTYIQRPLHPGNEVDARILHNRRAWEASRKPVKK